MHLFIVRHGECAGQVDPALGMDPDTVLTPRGEAQAVLIGRRLATLDVTHIVSSPLRRALATAAVVAEAAVLQEVAVWHELRELWEPLWLSAERAAMERQFPCARFPDHVAADGWLHGDESAAAVRARAAAVLERLPVEYSAEARVALVTHGGFATYVLSAILQIPPEQPVWFELANGAVSHLRFVPSAAQEAWPPLYPAFPVEVLALNDRRHLFNDGRGEG
jgi:probable phosphoglycerate mutase